MIHCMVSRRLGQCRKAQGPRLTVPESPSPALPEYSIYHADDNFLSDRRCSSNYEIQRLVDSSAFPQQMGVFSLQGITVDGRPSVLDDEENKESLSGPSEKWGRGEKMLSRHFAASNGRRNRRASLHGCEFRPVKENPVESEQALHPKEIAYLQKIALAASELSRKNLNNEMAHISLDGRIMNAVTGTRASRIGGVLEEEEAQAWDCFAPLQRVLIVAVAAAAAASTKQKNHTEINRLQRAVTAKEDALSLMRRELSNLWDEVASHENGPLSFKTPIAAEKDFNARSITPETPVYMNDSKRICSPSGLRGSPKTYRRLPNHQGGGKYESWVQGTEAPVNKGVVLVESSLKGETGKDDGGEAKWYSNPLMDHSGQSGESCQSGQSEHYFEDCTPEKRRRIFSRFTPDTREPVEWMSVKSSFTTISADAVTPLTHKKRFSMEANTGAQREEETNSEMTAMRARCASVLVEVKNQVLSVLDKEASRVMCALSHVIDKAQKLERMERPSSMSRRTHTPEKKAQVSTALKECVEKASAHVASLQAAVVSIWHTIGPQALASLNLSPSELESYLLRVTKETLLNNDGKSAFAVTEDGVQAWKHWMQANHDEAPTLKKLEAAANPSFTENNQLLCSPSWRNRGSEVASAIGAAVRKTVDSLMAPLDGRRADESYQSPIAKQRVSGLSEDAPEFLAQQLLGELEKAAAKVAGMESQMISLKQCVRESDSQREKAELKLAEARERDYQNQETFQRQIDELTRQLHQKESAYEDLMRSRKVMFLVKTKEITELREDCQKRDVALDDITAAAQATREASDQRLAVLEDICKRKDSAIHDLKQEIMSLEGKVHDLKLRSPLLLRGPGRRNFSSLPSNEEVLALENTFNEVSLQRNQGPSPPPVQDFLPLPCTMTGNFGSLRSSTPVPPPRDSRSQGNVFNDIPAQRNIQSARSQEYLPVQCTMTDTFGPVRSSTSSIPNRAKEIPAVARPLACSIDGGLFPSPPSTIFDDFLELESSLQALEVDEGSQIGEDVCTPADVCSLRSSQEEFVSVKGKLKAGLKKLKNISSGSCPESSGSSSKTSNPQRVRGSVAFTSSDENKKLSGVLKPTNSSSLRAQANAKGTKKEKENFGLKKKEEITWVNAGILTSTDFNTSINSRRVSSSSSVDLRESSSKFGENIVKRRRWI